MSAAELLPDRGERQTRRLRVFRYKQGDDRPHFDNFTVSFVGRTSVVEALRQIRLHQDPSLMIRHSCLHGSCGTCGMRVNGREVLGCLTLMTDLPPGPVTVEPLRNAPLLGDLVVDVEPTYRQLEPAGLVPVRAREGPGRPATGVEKLTQFQDCIECGLCGSACLVSALDPGYLGPATLWAAARSVEQRSRGDQDQVLAWAGSAHGCWRCHVAEECTAVCPAGADPAAAIMGLRRRLVGSEVRRLLTGRRSS